MNIYPLPSCRNCCSRWDWWCSPRRVAPTWPHPSVCSRPRVWCDCLWCSSTRASRRNHDSRWCRSSQSCPSTGSTSAKRRPCSRPVYSWWWWSAGIACSRCAPYPYRRLPDRRPQSQPRAAISAACRTAEREREGEGVSMVSRLQ